MTDQTPKRRNVLNTKQRRTEFNAEVVRSRQLYMAALEPSPGRASFSDILRTGGHIAAASVQHAGRRPWT